MKELLLGELLNMASEMARLGEYYRSLAPDYTLDEASREHNRTRLERRSDELSDLGLHMSDAQCRRLIAGLDEPAADLAKMCEELSKRLADECGLRAFVSLTQAQADLAFPPKPLFGDQVEKGYPAAAYEIEEAGKCLGLSRTTAAVFHCMRTLEVGIAAAAKCLGIPDPVKPAQRNWGHILKTIKDEVERRDKAAAWSTAGDKRFFEEVHASLDAVRNPWRNATMHVENKYTEEEAEHIFGAVRGFMRKLASRLDEEGEPKCP